MADLVFNKALENIFSGIVSPESDVFKAILTTGDPVITWEALEDVTNELADGNGYATGGTVVTIAVLESDGTLTFDSSDPEWDPITCTTPTHIIWYSDTSTGKKLICAKSLGSAVSVNNNNLTAEVNAAGLFAIPNN